MGRIDLDMPLVGVKILKDSLVGFEDRTPYRGASYCDAVRLATAGEEVLVTADSIEVCKWSPVVLGLKEPADRFDFKLEPRMPGVSGYFVAPMSSYSNGLEPDVVIVRARPEQLGRLIHEMGEEALVERYRGQMGRSALSEDGFTSGARVRFALAVNRGLARLRVWKTFDRFTRLAFKNKLVTRGFEAIISRAMADMSVCRNSTVIPCLEDSVNVSHFCTGAITWGQNPPSHMTSGFPFALFERVSDRIESPGKAR